MSSFNFRSEHVKSSSSPSSSSINNKNKKNSTTSNNNSNQTKNNTTSNNNTSKSNNNNRKVNNNNTTVNQKPTTTTTTPTTTTSSTINTTATVATTKTNQFYSSAPSASSSSTTTNTHTHTTSHHQSKQNKDSELNEFISSQASPYPIIDIGINLTNYQFNNEIKNVLDRCLLANVHSVILTGTSVKNSQHSIDLIKKFNNHQVKLYSTLGIHPHDAKTFKNINDLKNIYLNNTINGNDNTKNGNNPIKMIGECGLDYNRMFSSKEEQIKCFKEQIKLGIELNLPLFCHEREAHLDFLLCINEVLIELKLKKLPIPLIVHCFTGNEIELKKYIELDFYIGLTDFISMERGKLVRNILNLIPLNRILIETDSPFMLNQKWKFKRNEPCLLPRVLITILNNLNENLNLEQLARQVTLNTCNLLNINI